MEWDLSDLYEGPDDPCLESDLDEAAAAATAFRDRYRGNLGSLTAAELNEAVAERGRRRRGLVEVGLQAGIVRAFVEVGELSLIHI